MGGRADARPRPLRERLAEGEAARRAPRGGLPPRHRRDRQPDARAARRRGGGRAVRRQPAVHAGRRRRRRSPRRCEVLARRGEDLDAYAKQRRRRCRRASPQITIDDGADLLTVIHARGGDHRRPDRRHRGDHGRPAAPAPPRGRGRPALPGAGGERVAHRAHVQRPLRHRPVRARRHRARHQPPARRPHARAVRLRRHRARGSPSAPAAPAPR